jgi:hypothetical protein
MSGCQLSSSSPESPTKQNDSRRFKEQTGRGETVANWHLPPLLQSVPLPSVTQYLLLLPCVTQHLLLLPSVTQYLLLLPSVTQYLLLLPSVTQHLLLLPSVTQHLLLLPSVTQYLLLLPSVTQYLLLLLGDEAFCSNPSHSRCSKLLLLLTP